MNAQNYKGMLFGGAVFMAGLNAQALAQEGLAHQFGSVAGPGPGETNALLNFAYTGAPGGIFWPTVATSPLGFSPFSLSTGDLSVSVEADATGCSFTHYRASSTHVQYSYVQVSAWFWPMTDHTAHAFWGGGRFANTEVRLVESATGAVIIDSTDPAGAVTVELEEQRLYHFQFTSNEILSNEADAWGEFRIVTPCGPADIDGNGILNFDDIDAFVAGFLGGCP